MRTSLALLLLAASLVSAERRPNILFIIADDLAAGGAVLQVFHFFS